MLDKKVTKLAADIALMASAAGLPKHAFGIYNGLEYVNDDHTISALGLAIEFMNRKKYPASIEILQKHLKDNPKQEEAKVFLGLALMLEGRNKESEDILNKLVLSKNKTVMNMATELLNEIHNA